MKAFGTLLLIVGAIVLASCARPAPAEPTAIPLPTPTPTPLELFEATVPAASEITFAAARAEYEPHCLKIVVAEIAYDVESTTSLVSPFIGTIVYSVNEATRAYRITEAYAYQGGAWTLKDTQVDDPIAYQLSLLRAGYCTMTKP